MKVDVKDWARRIKKEEGEDVEVMIGIVKDGVLYTHVECLVPSMIQMVKEMGMVVDRNNSQRGRGVVHGAN